MSRRVSLDQISYAFVSDNPFAEEAQTNEAQIKFAKRAVLGVIHSRLTERQKQIILLYYFEKQTIPQIAKALGVNKSTVSRTLTRARDNIKKYLEFYHLR